MFWYRFDGVGFVACLKTSAFDCFLGKMRLTSSMESFFSIPLTSISLAPKLSAFAIKLSRVNASSYKEYHCNHLEKQFCVTVNFISFTTSWNLLITASFHNLVTKINRQFHLAAGLLDEIEICTYLGVSIFLGGNIHPVWHVLFKQHLKCFLCCFPFLIYVVGVPSFVCRS